MVGVSTIPTVTSAEDIRQFQLTDLAGVVAVRDFSDEQHYSDANSKRNLSSDIREIEIEVDAKAYVYHPNFLKLDVSGGPVFITNKQGSSYVSSLDSQSSGQDVDELTYNLTTRFHFLEKKPYPFSVFFERRNPLIVSGVDEHFLQRNTKFGVNAVVKEWKYPLFVNFEAYNLTSKASGQRLLVDDDISNMNLRVYQTNKRNGSRQVFVQLSQQNSHSGSVAPGANTIVGTAIDAQTISYDEYSTYGAKGEYSLKNMFNYMGRRYKRGISDVTLKQFHFSPVLHWAKSDVARMFYQLDLFKSSQGSTDTDNKNFRVGYKQVDENDGGKSAEFQIYDNFTSGHTMDSYGITASSHTSRKLGLSNTVPGINEKQNNRKKKSKHDGVAIFKASWGYQVEERAAQGSSQLIPVQNEQHTLVGANESRLSRINVDANTVHVWNITRTAEYILGSDFSTIRRGNETYLVRIVGGNIADGENVLVDYAYKTGGTFSHSSMDQQIQASMDWQNWLSVYAGLSATRVDVTEGTPGIDIRSSDLRNLGFNINYPVSNEFGVGGDFRFDLQRKGIAPHERVAWGGFAQYKLYDTTFFRYSHNFVKVDYDTAGADVNLVRQNFAVNTRAFLQSSIYLSYVRETDNGGEFPRDLSDFVVKWQWRFRSLYFSLNGRRSSEAQVNALGDVQKDRNLLRATLERRF